MELKGICNQGHLKKGINRAEEGNLHLLNDDRSLTCSWLPLLCPSLNLRLYDETITAVNLTLHLLWACTSQWLDKNTQSMPRSTTKKIQKKKKNYNHTL